MKTLCVCMVSLALVACGTSPAQLTASAVMAHAQTETTAPTNTLVPSATSTPTPVPTQTPVPTPLGGSEWIVFGTVSSTAPPFPGVFAIKPDGTGQRQLTEAGYFLIGISPDGQHILTAKFPDKSEYANLYVMNMDGQGGVPLASNLKVICELSPCAYWLPDGKQIALIALEDNEPHIFLISPDGTALQRITEKGSSPKPLGFLPSYENNRIYWEKGTCCIFSEGYWSISVDGTGAKELQPTDMVNPVFSPSGSDMAYRNFQGSLLVARNGGAEIVQVHPSASGVPEFVNNYSWSPNGDRLVYEVQQCTPTCGNSAYFIWSPSAPDPVTLPTDIGPSESGSSPIWSPDGQLILFTTYLDSQGSRIKLVDLRTLQVRELSLSLPNGIYIRQASFVP